MKLKGYIFSRPFLGERVPQHIQNIVLRDYCIKNNIIFLMSATEYAIENSSYILSELINNLKNYDGIIFYSLFQLPIKKQERQRLYKSIIKNKKQIHFAVESISVKNISDVVKIEKIFLVKIQTINMQKYQNSLGGLKNYIIVNHEKTSRNYLKRMTNDKVKCMSVANEHMRKNQKKYTQFFFKTIP